MTYEENWPLIEHTKDAWQEIRMANHLYKRTVCYRSYKIKDVLELEINGKKLDIEVGEFTNWKFS